MISETIGKVKITLFDSPTEIPIKNYNELNNYALEAAELGSSIDAVNKRFEKIDTFLAAGKTEEAVKERLNQTQTFYNIFSRRNLTGLQFCCLIHTMDGKRFKDLSEENIKEVLEILSDEGLTQEKIDELTEGVKKKFVIY